MNMTKEFPFRKLPITYLQALAKFEGALKSRFIDIKSIVLQFGQNPRYRRTVIMVSL